MRTPKPIPLAPRHRPVWKGLRRWCSCGLRWKTCPDRHVTLPVEPTIARYDNRPRWDDPTLADPRPGQAGWLTPAQTWRANGGRW